MKHLLTIIFLISASYAQVAAQGDTYRSTDSGITYRPQEAWHAEERGEGGALSTIFTSPDASSRIAFLVLSRALFADATVENAVPPGDTKKRFRKLKSPNTLSVAGSSFVRADFQQEGEPVYQTRLMSEAGSWRVLVIVSAPSQQAVEQLLASLASFSFSPPEPIKMLSDGRVLVDATEMQKRLIKTVLPQRPKLASGPHLTGTVNLRVVVGKDGKVKDVAIVNGDPVLSTSALDAIKQWEYRPVYYKGQPIEVETRVTVNFSLCPPGKSCP
jgi:TonB family protein